MVEKQPGLSPQSVPSVEGPRAFRVADLSRSPRGTFPRPPAAQRRWEPLRRRRPAGSRAPVAARPGAHLGPGFHRDSLGRP